MVRFLRLILYKNFAIKMWLSRIQLHRIGIHLIPFVWHRCGRFHLSAPVDFLLLRAMRMLLNHLRFIVVAQNQSAAALVLRASYTPPIFSAIFPVQIVVDDNQRSTALAVNVIQTLIGEKRERRIDRNEYISVDRYWVKIWLFFHSIKTPNSLVECGHYRR